LIYENKKLAIFGIAGVLVACLIITAVIWVPWHPSPKVLLGVSAGSGDELLRLEGREGVSYCQAIDLIRPPSFVMDVTLYEFSKPLGIGSEADLVITVTSKLNVSETFFVAGRIVAWFSESRGEYTEGRPPTGGVCFINESSRWVWTGEIDANSSKTFNLRIKAMEVSTVDLEIVVAKMKYEIIGDGIRTAYISWDKEYIFPIEPPYYKSIRMGFAIFRDNILVYPQGLPLIMQDGEWTYPPHVLVDMKHDIPMKPYPFFYGLGSEDNLTIEIYPFIGNLTDVTMRLVLEEGIALVEGQTTWTGNVTIVPYTVIRLPMKIRFVKVGTWYMYCYAEKDGIIVGVPRGFQVIVSNDDITYNRM